MLDLAETIEAYLAEHGPALPYEACHTLACGMTEKLFHYAARYSSEGDVGKHTDSRIARAIGWVWDAEWLIKTLISSGWLDTGTHRLFVHDWHVHSDDTCDRYLADNGLRYANGSPPRSKPRKGSKASKEPHAERETTPASRDTSTANRGLTETIAIAGTDVARGDAAGGTPVTDETRRAKFKPPTVDEVRAYCLERSNGIDPQLFVDSYTSKGWLVGKSPMRDWKAAVRTWERNGNPSGRSQSSAAPPPTVAPPIPSRIKPADFTR